MIPDVLGMRVNDAREQIRTARPDLTLVLIETHSRTEPEVFGIETGNVVKQELVGSRLELTIAFFA